MLNNLKSENIPVGNLYLDPNNPRFADNRSKSKPVRDEHTHEDQVQSRALSELSDKYDTNQLKESIKNIGFVPVDRLVVVPLPQPGKYMVVEGNRRLAAVKSLLKDIENRETEVTSEVAGSLETLPVLVIQDDDKTKREHIAKTLQGVRHVASIKSWGPYQQAQLIVQMIGDGQTPTEIKETIGLSVRAINELRRSFKALQQMENDDEYGEKAKPSLFSHFVEGMRVKPLREWLEWNENEQSFANIERRRQFYSWCVPDNQDGEEIEVKITDAKDLRQIAKLMDDSLLFKQFCDQPRLKLREAQSAVIQDVDIDWQNVIRNNERILQRVPAMSLANASDEEIELLEKLKTTCDTLIQYARNTSSTR